MQQQKTSPWLIAFRVIFTAALLACILFIFRNSMQTGEVSSARSQAVTTLVNGFLGKFGLGPLSEHIIRKLAHFSEFMLEGFLLMLCLRVYTRHFVRHISWPLLAGMSTALIQISIPNRTSSVTDVWIDMAGVIAGLFVALIILLILRATMAFYRVKRENKALRAEQEALRQREHERLARRAAHRAVQGEDNNEEEDEA